MSGGVFNERDRTDPTPGTNAEGTYESLDRVDDPAFARVRSLIEDWVERYPADHRDELVTRFRSGNNIDFDAVFWELYLHEAHRRLGYRITPHPETPKGRVDFLLEKDSTSFYLEATTATNPALTGVGGDSPGTPEVLDKINSAFDPDFFIKVEFVIPGQETPSRASIVKPLEKWLSGLDWEGEWDRSVVKGGEHPTHLIEARGWKISVRAHPKPPESRGDRSFPTIGIYPSVGGISLAPQVILEKLTDKAYAYGELDAPFVVAIWARAPVANEDDIQYALFGGKPALEPGGQRCLWRQGENPKATRVSGVLGAVGFRFSLFSIAEVWPRLWTNPWATMDLEAPDLPWPRTEVKPPGVFAEEDAQTTPHEFFDLDPDWPGRPFGR